MNYIKRLYCIVLVMVLFSICPINSEAAYVGEVTGRVYHSNLDTYINNYPINAYYKEGRQLVCAEDLRDYGFCVEWNAEERSLTLFPDYSVTELSRNENIRKSYWLQHKKAFDILYTDIRVFLGDREITSYAIDGKMMIPIRELEGLGHCEYSAEANYSKLFVDGLPVGTYAPIELDYEKKLVIVLDPGHGKSSQLMSDDEKTGEGYFKHNGVWGEWRHFKNGTADTECNGSDCRHDRSCWYPMTYGDRDTEPDINLKNALSAKHYLENELGYTVRLTRSTNEENPSFTKRVSYCYPNNDMTAVPDAAAYICLHSNAGGGRGSMYMAAEGIYNQKWVLPNYSLECNRLGECINSRLVAETPLSKCGSGALSGQGYLILFNKCPVPAGYMEIGFFDNASDLYILNSSTDSIGKSIAYGINDYFNQ